MRFQGTDTLMKGIVLKKYISNGLPVEQQGGVNHPLLSVQFDGQVCRLLVEKEI